MAKNKSTRARSREGHKASSSNQPVLPAQEIAPGIRKNPLLLSVVLYVVVLAVFLPALRNDFFYFYGDDTGYVTENSHVNTGFTGKNVVWAFRNIDLGNWHPLTWLSHMLDCQIYGLKPWGHHLTSALIHAANAVLLFTALRRMTGATWRCLAVAFLFGLHPLRVESVAWVAERKDVLAAFFWMLTLLFYARYAEESRARTAKAKLFYGFSIASFACGLMSKGIVVTLPCALLLLDYWPLQRHEQKSAWKLVLEKVPFFCLAAATSAITFAAQKSWGFVATMEKYSLAARIENAVVSYGRYLGKMFWPINLSGYYPHPGDWSAAIVFPIGILVLGISILAIATRRKWPWLPTGWFWYLGTLVPVIGLVQLADIAMANRYSYIPMIGILVIVMWGLPEMLKHWKPHAVVLTVALAAFLITCVVLTLQQITYFKDGVTVWRRNFEVTGNIEVAQYALGLSLSRQGRTEEAITEIQAVLKATPDNGQAHYNLANMFQRLGRVDESLHHYREAVKYAPEFQEARANLGLQLYNKELFDEALVQLQEAVRLDRLRPTHDAQIYLQFATALIRMGHLDQAIEILQEGWKIAPGALGIHLNLGLALAERQRVEEAIYHFEEVLKLDPDRTIARTYLESLKAGRGTP